MSRRRNRVGTTRTYTRTAAAAAASVVLAGTLAACGGSDEGARPSAAAHTAPNGDVFNDVDVRFATDMIPHHAQAVQMVEMTRGRPLDRDVRHLADAIRTAQVPEVETMSGWLTDWGEEVPATAIDHAHAGHDMGDMGDTEGVEGMDVDTSMPGMMSASEMDDLESASDDEFQDLWLRMMTDHHRGAIEMAQTELADGRFRDALRLAKFIRDAQQAEISRMETMLGS